MISLAWKGGHGYKGLVVSSLNGCCAGEDCAKDDVERTTDSDRMLGRIC